MKTVQSKKQLIILGVLLAVLAGVLYFFRSQASSGSSGSAVGKGIEQKSAATREDALVFEQASSKYGKQKEVLLAELDPKIHLEKLAQFNPGTPSTSRNMFALGALPPPPRPAQPPQPPPRPAGGVAANPIAAGPPPVVIRLKYIGVKTDPASKQRQGFFTSDNEVFLAAEGAIVANRYRVIRLSDTSAEIEELSSKTRQQVSMVAP
jgi:hypothetical protein